MSVCQIFSVIGLAALFLIAGCKKEEVTVEPGVKKKRDISISEETNTQTGDLDLSNIDP